MRPAWLLTPEVTVASVTIGVASAPNATGAVLAINATLAAWMGRKPSAISITTVTATGVQKPASASSSAPKQNATMMAWTRMSGLTRSKERRSTSKCPLTTVRLYTPTALSTIHMIGKKPKAAPSLAESSAWPTGMEYAMIATASATASEISPASHGFGRREGLVG